MTRDEVAQLIERAATKICPDIPDSMMCGEGDVGAGILTALEAAGFQVVPVEPNKAMLMSAWKFDNTYLPDNDAYKGLYRAMLAAAKE